MNDNVAEEKGEYRESKRPLCRLKKSSDKKLPPIREEPTLSIDDSLRSNSLHDNEFKNRLEVEPAAEKKSCRYDPSFFKKPSPQNRVTRENLKRQFNEIKKQTKNGKNIMGDNARKLYRYLSDRLDMNNGEINLNKTEKKINELRMELNEPTRRNTPSKR